MKKIIVTALVAVSVSLISCDQNEVNPDSVFSTATDLATAGGGGQPGADSTQRRGPGGMMGQRPEITEVAVADLSTSITDYITVNYPDATIDRAGTDPEGNFLVGVSFSDGSHTGLKFDVSGTFVEEKQKPKGGKGGPGGGEMGQRPELTEVDITALPASITDYITANYAEFTIEKAGTDADGNTAVLLSSTDQKVGVLFDASGTFQKELPPPPRKGGMPQSN